MHAYTRRTGSIPVQLRVCVCVGGGGGGSCSKSDWCCVRATVKNDGGVDGICATVCAVMCCVCDSE